MFCDWYLVCVTSILVSDRDSALRRSSKNLSYHIQDSASLAKLAIVSMHWNKNYLIRYCASFGVHRVIWTYVYSYYSVYTEKGKPFVLSVYLCQGKVAPPLTNLVTYPLCFTGYINCDVTSQLASLNGGGALASKNLDLNYWKTPLIKAVVK